MKEENIIILGLGLIGGSMALALKANNYQGKIIGFDIEEAHIKEALEARAIDEAANCLADALEYEGIFIIAAPLNAYENIFKEMAKAFSNRSVLVTDVGSIKTNIYKLAKHYLPNTVNFIGGHPMSGSEKGGFSVAQKTLFENAYYFLTVDNSECNLSILKDLVERIGAFPIIINPHEHDEIVARISHVPHIVASLLANMLDGDKKISQGAFVGGGFRDTTRIAAGNPGLWKDILLFNKINILRELEIFQKKLLVLMSQILNEEEAEVLEFFQRAKFIRDGLPKKARDYLPSLYNVFVDVEDKPGIIGELTQLVGKHQLNIREIEILHVRDNVKGAIRIGFASYEEQQDALKILQNFQTVSS